MIIRFLGTHNEESCESRLVSLLIDDILAVDAGSLVSELAFIEQEKIRAILLSHGHYDHIRAVPGLPLIIITTSLRSLLRSQPLRFWLLTWWTA